MRWQGLEKGSGNISVYAHGLDYHKVMKKTEEMGRWLVNETDAQIRFC